MTVQKPVPCSLYDIRGIQEWLDEMALQGLFLKGANRRWLELAGVRQIDVCDLCTACRGDLFWSHRKLGSRRGVQVSAIALEAAP